MALIEVRVPQLSESVAEATLLQWHKKAGEAVARDENLIDVETDKVVLELPAPAAGVLAQVIKGDGSTVVAGEVIAVIDTEAKAAAAPTAAAATAPAAPAAAAAAAPAAAPAAAMPTPAPAAAPAAGAKAGVAMPAAAKLMAEAQLTPAQVAGTGRDGRITKGDVIAATAAAARPAAPAIPTGVPATALPEVRPPLDVSKLLEGRPQQRVPMSRLRQRVAERLLQSQSTNAILTTFNEVNMQPVMDLRKRYQERFEKEHGVRLGFMSFFVKAAVHGLKKFPVVNASVDGNDIVYHGYFDIGVAVGSPRGLVVPVIRNADQMSFAQVEKQIADYGKRAQDGKLGIEELTGGTFSISNGGVFGSMLSTPIINPPQSAILGVHATKDRAVVEHGQVVVRPMNYLAVSYDHRIIDGREAVLFLVAIKEALEDPSRLLLDL
ncbi:MAG: dihydrolipoamide succinyltransferase [Lautropia sp. SCN 69-89]|nr:MAG: dihydrolipoamide succinyltransferase [Lautropia sp. SCN 69-89]